MKGMQKGPEAEAPVWAVPSDKSSGFGDGEFLDPVQYDVHVSELARNPAPLGVSSHTAQSGELRPTGPAVVELRKQSGDQASAEAE